MSDTPRRAVLRGVGALACCTLGGSSARPAVDERLGVVVDRPPIRSTPVDDTPRADFVWLAPGLWRDDRTRQNLVAFAARHDLAVMFSQPIVTDREAVDHVVTAMTATSEAGATPWLETAVPHDATPKQLVDDADARERHLTALRSAARRYANIVPDGNLLLWEEAPVAGEWIPGGTWNSDAVDALKRYGPALFAHQRAAVAEAAPDLAAGLFVHFPYVVETRQPGVFANLMDDLTARESLPDFVFTDFYRGWYEKDVGPGPANAAVRSLVSNARRHSRGRPVYFLGQAHTIDPRHTSSTQAMRMDLRAATAAGARGVGWYARTVYKQTRRGFDPFVPNEPEESAIPTDGRVNTLTIARDRYRYAYRATLAARSGFDPLTRFDCWVHADSPGFYGHRVSVGTGEDWLPLGDIAAAHPTVAPVDSAAHVSVFHALDGRRFVSDGELSLRIDTHDGHTGRLRGVYVLPFDPGVTFTERDATRLLDEQRVTPFALGAVEREDSLTPETPLELTVPVAGADETTLLAARGAVPPVANLLTPGTLDYRTALVEAESRTEFDRGRRFDCWVRAHDVDDPSSLFERFGLDATPVTAAAGDGAAVFWGLPRQVLGDDASGTLADRVARAFDGTTVEAAYAMPYFGSEDVRLPAQIGALLRDSPDDVATFSFAHAER